ncbi:MAG: 50S ribosomal protein L6, partial [Armatimonadetes bacterium]|nr:50S ribosomal protein L6 [Armatimonadota bacterium]
MSRIGKQPIPVPSGVTVTIDGSHVKVKGPKGELARTLNSLISVRQAGSEILVERPNDERQARSLHGLTRTLVSNMVEGVTKGFERELQMIGVGYKAQLQGNDLLINIGYSHPVLRTPPAGISFRVEPGKGVTKLFVQGIDRQVVGQTAAELRAIRPPEPYKGKGIRYADETIIKK